MLRLGSTTRPSMPCKLVQLDIKIKTPFSHRVHVMQLAARVILMANMACSPHFRTSMMPHTQGRAAFLQPYQCSVNGQERALLAVHEEAVQGAEEADPCYG